MKLLAVKLDTVSILGYDFVCVVVWFLNVCLVFKCLLASFVWEHESLGVQNLMFSAYYRKLCFLAEGNQFCFKMMVATLDKCFQKPQSFFLHCKSTRYTSTISASSSGWLCILLYLKFELCLRMKGEKNSIAHCCCKDNLTQRMGKGQVKLL